MKNAETRKTKPKSFQPTPEQLLAIKDWSHRYSVSQSEVIRVALNIGLRALNKDPTPLEKEHVGQDEISPPPRDDSATLGASRRSQRAEDAVVKERREARALRKPSKD